MENFTQGLTQSGLSFPKSRCFFRFSKKGRGGFVPPSSCSPDFQNRYYRAKMIERKRINFSLRPYWALLFSRKENIKSSEVALVAVHCNCLIGCIMIARRYLSCNTANTKMDIYLLVGNGN